MGDLKNKRIITIATTGAWPKKENNPNVPMTPAEISEDVYDCWKAGAAIAHIHMRDDQGNGTMDHNKFRETVELLKKNHPECDIIINMTTSGDIYATDETRVLHVKEPSPAALPHPNARCSKDEVKGCLGYVRIRMPVLVHLGNSRISHCSGNCSMDTGTSDVIADLNF